MMTDDELTDPDTDPGLRLTLRPPGPAASVFDREDAVVEQFRAALFAEGLVWREQRFDGMTTWLSPESPHCWVCFIREKGRLAALQVSFPEPDSEWGRRLAAATVRVAIRLRLTVEY